MDAYWHNNGYGPSGFFDNGNHIVVVPNLLPRPNVVVDHELTHCNLVHATTVGWVQLVCQACSSINPTSIAADISRYLMEATEPVHEAVAWLGTELITIQGENLKAPRQYASLADRMRSSISKIQNRPFSITRNPLMMELLDCLGMYALNSPAIGRYISGTRPWTLQGFKAAISLDNPEGRMTRICSLLEGWTFDQVTNWMKFINDPTTSSNNIPHFDRQSYFGKSMSNSNLMIEHSARLAGVGVDKFAEILSLLINQWLISPQIDPYAQTCLASKPTFARTVYIPDDRADEIFKSVPWVLVSTVDHEGERGFERQGPIVGDEVTIFVGEKIPNRGPNKFSAFIEKFRSEDRFLEFAWRTSAQRARQFLLEYSKRMRCGIVVPGNLYDYGKGDLLNRRILWDIPHCVGHVTDIRTLWFKIGFQSEGLKGNKRIAYELVSSDHGYGEFGFLIFKPTAAKFPVIVVPTLEKYAQRAMSVVSQFPSPYGCSMFNDPAFRSYADGCEASLAAAIQGLEESFTQAPEMVSQRQRLFGSKTQ